MENKAVKTETIEDAYVVINLFKELGYKRPAWTKNPPVVGTCVFVDYDGDILTGDLYGKEEISLSQLKELVVLKRNDRNDRAHYCESTNGDYFVSSGNIVYFFDDEPSLQVQHETPENKVKIVNAIESAYAAKSINDQYAEIEQVRQKTVQDTLLERQKEYGCFEDVAFLTQGLIDFLSKHTNYDEMPKPHKEALHMIASKVARLTLGNFNHKDSWHDIGGYAKLIEDLVD